MEVETQHTLKRIHYTILVIALVAVSLGLLGVIWITTSAYFYADDKTRSLLFHLAWVAAASLALTLVVLAWIVLRWIRLRIQLGRVFPKSELISAWEEAGKRIPVPETDDVIEEPDEFAEDDLPGDIDELEDDDDDEFYGDSDSEKWDRL